MTTQRIGVAAEMAALGGKQLFYLSRGNTLVELVQLPDGRISDFIIRAQRFEFRGAIT